jgi:8-oxo-dGTP pyrophosphatase MutT (NUDIX family)
MFYFNKPSSFNPSMKVVICYLINKEETLFLRRSESKFQGCLWTAPGGKIESGEDSLTAIKREVFEETGFDLPQESFILNGTYYIKHPNIDFTIYIYKSYLDEKPAVILSKNEHDRYQWITAKKALNLKLIPDGDQCLFVTFSDISIN